MTTLIFFLAVAVILSLLVWARRRRNATQPTGWRKGWDRDGNRQRELLEDRQDIADSRAAAAESPERIPWSEVKARLHLD